GALPLYLSILFTNLVFSEWAWASLSVLESELFPTGVRASVVGLVTATAWLINTSLVFAEASITAGQFLAINAALWLVGLVASLAWALHGVESAGKRLEELY
ncbi:MAG: MFS transporter, partial [Pyrobaculum sp.]